MELQLDNGEYQVVFRDSNLNVTIEESAPLNVVVGESARIEVGEALNYIQSGTQEIAEAVQEGIASFDSNAQEKTSEFNANYTEKKALIDAQVDIAEEQANIATSQAQMATVQAGIATTKAGEATTSASNASLSETNASQSATTATTQAGIATTKAGEASSSASNALASETSASNSAISASNSANLAKQWAIGDPSEPAGNSAKYWADYAEEIAQQVGNPANKDLSNLSATGYSLFTNLQTQIDAIVSSSDVFDIVGTYAELQAYDISTVPVNDIIKVLVDSTHSGAATYYRCIETAGVKSWSYIGSEGAYYTKGEADGKFSTILATGSSLDYTGNTLSLENSQGTVLSSVTIKSTPDNVYTKSEVDGLLSAKQNTLIAGTNITITNNTISASGVNMVDIVDALYPVGSCYIGTGNVCPISLIKGTWTLQSSGIVTSVNTTVGVRGNGKSLGMTDGTSNYGFSNWTGNGYGARFTKGAYNADVGGGYDNSQVGNNSVAYGVVNNVNTSGLTGVLTRTVLSVNIWKRTA